MKLHQVIAVLQPKKAKSQRVITEAHHGWAEALITGMTRVYTPRDEQGEQLPKEVRLVQKRVLEVLPNVKPAMADFWDEVYTQESGNTLAKANLQVGTITLKDLPVGFLLFLEKQIEDVKTFISKIPVLPADKTWNFDENTNTYVSDTTNQVRTKKTMKVLTKAEATVQHPAQTEVYAVDEVCGMFATTHFSGALPEKTRAAMFSRAESLLLDVKRAREEANGLEVQKKEVGASILNYILG